MADAVIKIVSLQEEINGVIDALVEAGNPLDANGQMGCLLL